MSFLEARVAELCGRRSVGQAEISRFAPKIFPVKGRKQQEQQKKAPSVGQSYSRTLPAIHYPTKSQSLHLNEFSVSLFLLSPFQYFSHKEIC